MYDNKKEMQKKIDVEKWLKSEKAGRDLCGEEDFCAYCDKSEEYPCGRAYVLKKEAIAGGTETRLRRGFLSKLIQNAELQKKYSVIKNEFLKYSKVKGRIAFSGETFRLGREKLGYCAVRGKSLYLYLALDVAEFENSVYRYAYAGDKKAYSDVPMKLKIGGGRSLKRATELIDKLAEKRGLKINAKFVKTEQKYDYLSDDELIKQGLIKTSTVVRNGKKPE